MSSLLSSSLGGAPLDEVWSSSLLTPSRTKKVTSKKKTRGTCTAAVQNSTMSFDNLSVIDRHAPVGNSNLFQNTLHGGNPQEDMFFANSTTSEFDDIMKKYTNNLQLDDEEHRYVSNDDVNDSNVHLSSNVSDFDPNTAQTDDDGVVTTPTSINKDATDAHLKEEPDTSRPMSSAALESGDRHGEHGEAEQNKNRWLDLALYVLSGILLIIILENFIQLGVNMGVQSNFAMYR